MNIGLSPNALKVFEYYSLAFLCLVRLRTRMFQTVKPQGRFTLAALRFETFLMRRRAKTQKYKGVKFEQFKSVWAYLRSVAHISLKTKQRKTTQENKTQGKNKVNR